MLGLGLGRVRSTSCQSDPLQIGTCCDADDCATAAVVAAAAAAAAESAAAAAAVSAAAALPAGLPCWDLQHPQAPTCEFRL